MQDRPRDGLAFFVAISKCAAQKGHAMPITYKLAHRIREVQPSATLAVDGKAKALQAQGKDIVGYGVGEPDFNTPEHICQAAVKAIGGGDTKYAAKRGIELKKSIVEKLRR